MTRKAAQWQRRTLQNIVNTASAYCDIGLDDELNELRAWLDLGPLEDEQLTEAKLVVRARSKGACEARTPACVDTGPRPGAVDVHHRAGRGFDGCHAPELLLDCCDPCHDFIHANPEVAYARGWMLHRNSVEVRPARSKIVSRAEAR